MLVVVALACGWTTAALADLPNQDLVCSPDEPVMEDSETLRAWSLQLRGYPPTINEYDAVETGVVSSQELLQEWLSSPDFAEQSVRFHRNHFWPNITNVNLFSASFSLRREGGSFLYWRRTNATLNYRGDFVTCLDEPAEFDAYGNLIAKPQADGTDREGYVLVSPYWAPDTTIKVCGYDAQDNTHGLTGVFCGGRSANTDISCGCGPDLRYCRYGTSQLPVTRALGTDLDERVRAVMEEDEAYTELFTSQRGFVNGPLSFFLRYQTGVFAGIRFDPLSVSTDTIPEMDYTAEDTWYELSLDSAHAGILTAPAYLIRFQTDRARANRFFDSFLCQPFQAPDSGIPVGEEAIPHPDLQQRDGCKYCHALLEPAAAHWGRWAEGGAGYLDPETYPRHRDECMACATYGVNCSEDCNRFYLTKPLTAHEAEFLGELKSYVFRRADHEINVEAGPELLVSKAVGDGRLPLCVAKRTSEWLLGRSLEPREEPWLTDLATHFVASGLRFKELVHAIVTSDTYRRVR
ncbi:MAG: hypothetical protein CL940_09040 [Deltaproteobacteria bacterium]|nr:hypothetical protein [Deltaproteobacteria bacterium]